MKLRRFLPWGAWKLWGRLSLAASLVIFLPISTRSLQAASASTSAVWHADHEVGNLSEWREGTSKTPEQDSKSCFRPSNGVSSEVAYSGKYSMKMSIDSTVDGSGCRQFRYPEILTGKDYYYSAWFYFPENYKVNGWSNLFQFKAKNSDGSKNDPIWNLRVSNRSNGNMYFYLNFKGSKAGLKGPMAGDPVQDKNYQQSLLDIPVRKWTHMEAYFRQSSAYGGRITVWQDGVQLFDFDNVITKFTSGDNRWSVNAYGHNITPNPFTVFIDDAAVSSTRLGPGASPPAPAATPTNAPVSLSDPNRLYLPAVLLR